MNRTQEQALALGGIMTCCCLVDDVARNGECDEEAMAVMLETLFITDPPTALSVYSKPEVLSRGFSCLVNTLDGGADPQNQQALRYGLAIMHLQRKLMKDQAMLASLSKRLENAQQQREHFGIQHENVIHGLASIYQDTISTYRMKIQVSGHARYLQVDYNAAKIRALLLAAIRSATLWRQVGGHRWHFLMHKSRLINAAKEVQQQVSPV